MSRIRRIRYVAPHKVKDDNPYIPEGEVRYHWPDWVEVEVFEDADVMQIDGNHRMPGQSFQLRVPMTDPETGEDADCDGDRALLRVRMVGADLDYWGYIAFRGFVSKHELAYERQYRARSRGESYDIDEDLDYRVEHEYVREEWQILDDRA